MSENIKIRLTPILITKLGLYFFQMMYFIHLIYWKLRMPRLNTNYVFSNDVQVVWKKVLVTATRYITKMDMNTVSVRRNKVSSTFLKIQKIFTIRNVEQSS